MMNKPELFGVRAAGTLGALLLCSLWLAPRSQSSEPQARDFDLRVVAARSTVQQGKLSADLSIKALENPSKPGSISPNWTPTPDGRTLLSWLEPSGNGDYALRFAIRTGRSWAVAQTVATRRNFIRHPAELPVVTMLSRDNFVALWTQGKGESREGEDAYAAGSRDGGRTWSTPVRVHHDDSKAEHGLISMTPVAADAALIVWLDGGNGKTAELKQARVHADGTVSGEITVDSDVCESCPTSILQVGKKRSELLLAYRDHAPDGVRDISFVKFRAGRWSVPRPLHRDGWLIDGCPTNSVQLASDQDRVVATWFTAANELGMVKAAFSGNGGDSFSGPIKVNENVAMGRASVALLPSGSAVVSWAEKGSSASTFLIREVAESGKLGPPLLLASGTRAFPRLERAGRQVLAAWSDATSVRTAVIE